MSEYYSDYGDKIYNLLNRSYNKKKEALAGVTAGQNREAQARLNIANRRAGVTGSPIGTALKEDVSNKINTGYRRSLANLASNKLNTEANLAQNIEGLKIKEKIATDQANSNLLNSIFEGIGFVAGNGLGSGGFITKLLNKK